MQLPRKPISVIVVDDHPVIRTGIRAMLEEQGEFCVVAEAVDFASALASWVAHRPEIVVADIGLPGRDGVALVIEICVRYSLV